MSSPWAVRLEEECPRRVSAHSHERGNYFHGYTRYAGHSRLLCVVGEIVWRRELPPDWEPSIAQWYFDQEVRQG